MKTQLFKSQEEQAAFWKACLDLKIPPRTASLPLGVGRSYILLKVAELIAPKKLTVTCSHILIKQYRKLARREGVKNIRFIATQGYVIVDQY